MKRGHFKWGRAGGKREKIADLCFTLAAAVAAAVGDLNDFFCVSLSVVILAGLRLPLIIIIKSEYLATY